MSNTSYEIDSFTSAYIETAIWSTTTDEGESLDRDFDESDLSDGAREEIKKDCADFLETYGNLIRDAIEAGAVKPGRSWDEYGRAGHDFWLTRNGHGAGFWDGDWDQPFGDKLTDAAKTYGPCDIYVGDDGKLYI